MYNLSVCVCVSIYTYIYIYRERDNTLWLSSLGQRVLELELLFCNTTSCLKYIYSIYVYCIISYNHNIQYIYIYKHVNFCRDGRDHNIYQIMSLKDFQPGQKIMHFQKKSYPGGNISKTENYFLQNMCNNPQSGSIIVWLGKPFPENREQC